MSFQNPAALFWLVPLAGIVVLLYLLKMKRRDVRVPATFLWPAQVDEVRANALFQRLRPNWLLFLQLLALSLAVLAMAKPQTYQRGLSGAVTVLVVDSSASMGAIDVKPSRLEEAKRLAREAIQSARPSDRFALIEAGPTPRVIFPLGNDTPRQLRALDQIHATDAETDVGEAMRLASALVGGVEGARIVLLSDGDFEPIRNFSRGKAAVVYRRIGSYDDNLAINAVGLADSPAGKQVFCGVRNDSSKPMEGTLTLYADGRPFDSIRTGGIAPHAPFGRTIAVPAGAKVIEAKLEAPDILKSDNYAVCLVDPGASLRVLLVSRGNPFLEKALALDPRVTLERAAEVPPEDRGVGRGRYDLVVFDGIPEVPVKARGVLTFGAAGPASPVVDHGTAKSGAFVSSEAVALMKGVDLSGVFLEKQHQVTPKGVGESLAQNRVGPLVVAAKTPNLAQVYVAFEPLQSDFPLQVGFPIFIANVLDYVGNGVAADAMAVKAGVPFSLPLLGGATLTDPEGSRHELKPTGASLIVREVDRVGVYTLDAGGKRRTLYSYLRSERESNVAPVTELKLGGGQVKESQSPLRYADFWQPLALVCLVVLAGEWWLFARKS